MRGRRDLSVAALAAIACAVVAVAVPVEPIRVIAVLPLAFVLPGWAVVQASFARRRLEWPALPMLTLGLSLSILALGAVVLHVLPGRFGEASWAVLLVAVTLAGCVVAALRRPVPEPGRHSERPALWARLPRPSWLEGALLASTAVVVAAATVLATTLLPAGDAIGYTRLWMLPSRHGAKVSHVSVGVTSEEQDPAIYRLVLDVGGKRSIRRMRLDPGARRVWRVVAPPAAAGHAVPVLGQLYTRRDPYKLYRHVTGWIPAH